MRKREQKLKKTFGLALIALVAGFLFFVLQSDEAKAQNQSGKAKLFLSPATGSFLVGSTFDVSIVLDTGGVPVNTGQADLKFSADKLQIVSPSSGQSVISLWLKQPVYSNIEGTISFVGGAPESINTSSGIISIITFRVIKAGEAVINILPSSSVLAHDGKGTEILSERIGAVFTLKPRPPEGPRVFSQTHPDETRWYNNKYPVVSWEKETGVTDFSFVLDSYPQTIPDNIADTQETTKAFENLGDGLWYFHIKAQKAGVWGGSSHFLLRIDSTPPAPFEPKVEFLLAAIIGRAFVTFFTTDALSGLDHYEVAVVDKMEPPVASPIFIETESYYQIPRFNSGYSRIIVRAIDNAGNVRDASVDAKFPEPILLQIKKNAVAILLGVLALIALYFLARFLRQRGFFARLIKEIKDFKERFHKNDPSC